MRTGRRKFSEHVRVLRSLRDVGAGKPWCTALIPIPEVPFEEADPSDAVFVVFFSCLLSPSMTCKQGCATDQSRTVNTLSDYRALKISKPTSAQLALHSNRTCWFQFRPWQKCGSLGRLKGRGLKDSTPSTPWHCRAGIGLGGGGVYYRHLLANRLSLSKPI